MKNEKNQNDKNIKTSEKKSKFPKPIIPVSNGTRLASSIVVDMKDYESPTKVRKQQEDDERKERERRELEELNNSIAIREQAPLSDKDEETDNNEEEEEDFEIVEQKPNKFEEFEKQFIELMNKKKEKEEREKQEKYEFEEEQVEPIPAKSKNKKSIKNSKPKKRKIDIDIISGDFGGSI